MTVTDPRPAAPQPASRRPPLNLFGIAFGLAGIAGTWTAAQARLDAPAVIADALWIVAAATWLVTVARYAVRAGTPRGCLQELRHPVLGPFAALVPTTGLLLGIRLTHADATAGRAWIVVMAVLVGALGVWFVAGLLSGEGSIDTWHGGYLLPSTAAPLIMGQAFAVAGWPGAARAAFAVGVLSWIFLGAVLLARFAVRPLPDPLVPTLAIFSAPPAVAGNAWFAIDGGATDAVQQFLLGTFVLLVGVQAVLLPRYARLPFGYGWWSFTFPSAAGATYAVGRLATAQPVGWRIAAWMVVAAASGIVGLVAVRSVALARRARAA